MTPALTALCAAARRYNAATLNLAAALEAPTPGPDQLNLHHNRLADLRYILQVVEEELAAAARAFVREGALEMDPPSSAR